MEPDDDDIDQILRRTSTIRPIGLEYLNKDLVLRRVRAGVDRSRIVGRLGATLGVVLILLAVIAAVSRSSSLDQRTSGDIDVQVATSNPTRPTGTSSRLGDIGSLRAIAFTLEGAPDDLAMVIRVTPSVDCALDEWRSIRVVPIVEETSEAVMITLARDSDGQALCSTSGPAVLTVNLVQPYNGRALLSTQEG